MSSADTECRGCGGHVTAQFARVFGDNDHRVFSCPECSTGVELYEGEAATRKKEP